MLLAARNLVKSYGPHRILDGVSLLANAGDRIGIVGANGAGKSTLLRILAGNESSDSGAVVLAAHAHVGYLAQTPPNYAGQTLDDAVRAATASLSALESRMRALEAALTTASEAELPPLLDEYGAVSTRFQDRGGYELEATLATVLAGLRLDYLPRDRACETLSGGEKARLGLAQLLLQQPDVLLLDEPTNHLDFASLAWLESWLEAHLARQRGAVLVVSHDRAFLNATVGSILHLDEASHKLAAYPGDYDAYAAAKVAERVHWDETYARQQEEIAELRKRIREGARQVGHEKTFKPGGKRDKLSYKAAGERVAQTVSRNVRSASEQLARIEADPIARPPKPFHFSGRFAAESVASREVLVADALAKSYGPRHLFAGLSFTLAPGARVLLAGPNGAGKSTLLRLLLGLEPPDAGLIRRSPAARIGYLPQESPSAAPGATLLETYREGLIGFDDAFIAGLIGYGFFRLEDIAKPVAALSAGQRRKLELARLIAARPNVLLLDEPTNHVSLDVLEAFEAALFAFPGPVLAVSHDRYFIRRFGADVWELRDGALHTLPVDAYLDASLARDSPPDS
ncbi:MAG TPA: ABC-F family ATP-binding cassette domain-containing protein [Ktedonobacterales bacterium]